MAELSTRQPDAWEAMGAAAMEHCAVDFGHHIDYLEQSLRFGDEGIFAHYLTWLEEFFRGMGWSDSTLSLTLDCIEAALRRSMPAVQSDVAIGFLDTSRHDSGSRASKETTLLPAPGPHAAEFLRLLLSGNHRAAGEQALGLVEEGMDIRRLYIDVFQASQRELGRLWLDGRIGVAQEHFCTAATQAIMSRLYPRIFSVPRVGRRLVAAAVGDELHEIGVRMVADFFELEGWDSVFLGANTPAKAIAATIEKEDAELLCLSATMLVHIPRLTETIATVRSSCPPVRIMVGGYPFNLFPDLWKKVGADAFARDAQEAVATALAGSKRVAV